MTTFNDFEFEWECIEEEFPELNHLSFVLPPAIGVSTAMCDQDYVDVSQPGAFSRSAFAPLMSDGSLSTSVAEPSQLSSSNEFLSAFPCLTISPTLNPTDFDPGTPTHSPIDTDETISFDDSQSTLFLLSQRFDAADGALRQNGSTKRSLDTHEHTPEFPIMNESTVVRNRSAQFGATSQTDDGLQSLPDVRNELLHHSPLFLNFPKSATLPNLSPKTLDSSRRLERVSTASGNVNWRLRKLISQLSLSSSLEESARDLGGEAISASVQFGDVQSTQPPGQLVLCFGRAKRKRINRKPVEVGNNKMGRTGNHKCAACRKRKRKLPCEFCLTRGTEASCVKLRGEKTEELLARPIPTPDDQIIDSQEVLLLQYAYSETFASVTSWKVQRLFRKFGVAFAASINSVSLRHAMLAYSAAFSPISSGYERMEYHSNISCQALKRRTPENITEGDLFAACLLTYLSCAYRDRMRFRVHLKGVTAIMKECVKQSSKDGAISHYSAFWPLARDLILEGSRRVAGATTPILVFCHISRQVRGHEGMVRRSEYEAEMYGVNDGLQELAFRESMLHYYVILRRCLWLTVCTRIETGATEVPLVRSVVSEVKADLNCNEATDIVLQLSSIKDNGYPLLSASEAIYPLIDRAVYPLLLHRVCGLLIAILEDEMALRGSPSREVVQAANAILHLFHRVEEFGSEYPWNHVVRILGELLPRILCIVSLGLGGEMDNERTFQSLARC